MTHDLEFEQEIKDFSPEGRFLARQVRDIRSRITILEKRDQKTFGFAGGLGVFFGGLIVGAIEYFRTH